MLDRLARTLSGGMLRRLEIATALLNRRRCCSWTSPRWGLTQAPGGWSGSACDALREQAGTTIVVTTHLMEEAEHHCDRLAMIDLDGWSSRASPRSCSNATRPSSLEEVFTLGHRPPAG